MNKKVLTTYEIAGYCQVTPRTAVQWINEGKLKAFRTPGNHSRVSLEDFLDFLESYGMPVPAELALQRKGAKKRILIVDDDEDMVDALERFLKRERLYELQSAYDGFEAGRKFSDFKPDLILLDLKMPGINGYRLCADIRSNPANKDVKIILISGVADERDAELKKLGADAYVPKPFKIEELREKLRVLLAQDNAYEKNGS